jgi:hypothetical protein
MDATQEVLARSATMPQGPEAEIYVGGKKLIVH